MKTNGSTYDCASAKGLERKKATTTRTANMLFATSFVRALHWLYGRRTLTKKKTIEPTNPPAGLGAKEAIVFAT